MYISNRDTYTCKQASEDGNSGQGIGVRVKRFLDSDAPGWAYGAQALLLANIASLADVAKLVRQPESEVRRWVIERGSNE